MFQIPSITYLDYPGTIEETCTSYQALQGRQSVKKKKKKHSDSYMAQIKLPSFEIASIHAA